MLQRTRAEGQDERSTNNRTSLSRHLQVAAWAMRSETDPSDSDGPGVARRVVKGLASSALRRYVIQKYPGSSAETGFKLGSAKTGPLVWMMLGEVASTKQEAVLAHADRYKTLVETGTFRGDMVAACAGSFERVVSVELSQELYDAARQRFEGVTNVELFQGDSANVLPGVLETLDEPALFWLDAHYSFAGDAMGDKITPIMSEVETILSHPLPHRILIDDANSFLTRDDYPSVGEIGELAAHIRPGMSATVEDDIIHISQVVSL